ncbi:MAG: molecular chaperone TorD family protein [Planctomycetes bacterium]|nr:molecular chaperone TorD family protein [Planctomycetota bacterium]
MEDVLASICQRADSYKFLSECYYLPEEDFKQKVAEVANSNQFFSELEACIGAELELETLKVDFTQLFVGPFKLLAPPYGSVYLEDGQLMGESTIDVNDWYEKEGLDIVISDAPDHIAMELEFIYCLIVKQLEATKDADSETIQSCIDKQKSFLQTHLARWLPAFVENVQKHAKTDFYKKLAQLTGVFIQKDMDTLSLGA